MKRAEFNETAIGADLRERSLWTCKRLNIQIMRTANKLKRAYDAAKEIKLSLELRQDDPESWIGEDDD